MYKVSIFQGSPLRRLGGDAAIAAGTSLLAKVVGFGKEVLVASLFGLSGEIDTYLVAMVLVGFPMSILLNAAQSAMIARLAALSGKDNVDATTVFQRTLVLILAALTGLLLPWLAAMPVLLPIVASGFSPAKQEQLWNAIWLLLPYYFLCGINLLGYGLLQVRRQYLQNGLVPMLTPLVTIGLLWAGHENTSPLQLLTVAIVSGALLEAAALGFLLNRTGIWLSRGAQPAAGTRVTTRIAKETCALLPGTAIMALGPLVDQGLAATLAEGSNAALAYGSKLPAAIQGVLVSTAAITVLPFFATQLSNGSRAYCLWSLKRLSLFLGFGGAIAVIPLAMLSPDIVALLYQRGEFTPENVSMVAPIQSIYFLQIPSALIAMLCMKALIAKGHNILVSTLTMASALIQIGFSVLLKEYLGATGIAAAASASSAIVAAIYFWLAASRFSSEPRISRSP